MTVRRTPYSPSCTISRDDLTRAIGRDESINQLFRIVSSNLLLAPHLRSEDVALIIAHSVTSPMG